MKHVVDIDMKAFAEKGEYIFREISARLEAEHKGEIVAIEVESGDYFLAPNTHEALQKARERYPDKIFHIGRIGYRTVARRGWLPV